MSKKYSILLLSLLLLILAVGVFKYFGLISWPVTARPTIVFPTTVPKSTTTTTIISRPNQSSARHVIVILLENENESNVKGSNDAPYINNILIPNYSIAEDYYALAHPSLPNYIAIISGSTFGISSNDYPTMSLPYKNLVDLFSEHNVTWKAYMESMQGGSCNNALTNAAGGTYGYFTKHDPFVYYKDIMISLPRCSRIVPLTQFGVDMASNQLPEFSFITPNILDDGHTAPQNASTCPPSGTNIRCVDDWLSGFLPKVIDNPVFSNTIIFITWDESARIGNQITDTNPNYNVLLLAISPYSKKGFVDSTTFYSHYSLLATIEKIYALGNLGRNDTTANVLNDLFVNDTV